MLKMSRTAIVLTLLLSVGTVFSTPLSAHALLLGQIPGTTCPNGPEASLPIYEPLRSLLPGAPEENVPRSEDQCELLKLALRSFPDLSACERGLLRAAENGYGVGCGTSGDPNDSTNDPAPANSWVPSRRVRASLITWLVFNRLAAGLVNSKGIEVLGALIVDRLDLAHAAIPFQILLRSCALMQDANLIAAEIPELQLDGSWIGGPLLADTVRIQTNLVLKGIHALRGVELTGARIGGSLEATGATLMPQLNVTVSFEAGGPRYHQPLTTLSALGAQIQGRVELNDVHSDGIIDLSNASLGILLDTTGLVFSPVPLSPPGMPTGLVLYQATTMGMRWKDVKTDQNTIIYLEDANVGRIDDDALSSWPQPGNLFLNGLKYERINGSVDLRLQWLKLQGRFYPQPFQQLADALRNNGDDAGATRVLIAGEDARLPTLPTVQWLWENLLRATIGYGYRPFRVGCYFLFIVGFGWFLVWCGRRGRIMIPTPERPDDPLSPLVYSLDTFLPIIDLHQEKNWWPDAGRRWGWALRVWLWFEICAGWILSTLFLAGVTGLIRR
jgi:hypothetical protein